MIKLLSRFVLLLAVWNWNQDTINALSSACLTPNGKTGKCVSLYECPQLINLIRRRGNNLAAVNYLKNSKCRARNGNRSVCCPTVTDIELCGRIDVGVARRIAGGEEAEFGDYPWMVAVGYRNSTTSSSESIGWYCGGALISSRYVLTAGHCISGTEPWQPYIVRLGVISLNDSVEISPNTVDIQIEETVLHENFSGVAPKMENDIALIRLEREVSYSDYIKPICLPRQSHFRTRSMNNETAYVAGWGVTSFGGSLSPTLQHVDVPIVDLEYCKENYRKSRAIVDSRNLCAGYSEGGKDACQGDSGGPLMWPNKTEAKYYTIGIVSFGRICAAKGVPGVYTRVSEFVDFIDSNIY